MLEGYRSSIVAHLLALGPLAVSLAVAGPTTAFASTPPQQGGGSCNFGELENTLPESEDDSYGTRQNTTLLVEPDGILENDVDVDEDSLAARLRQDVSHGTLALDSDGSFTYTPDPAFAGEDTFTYVADDGCDTGSEATVTITVTACTYALDPTSQQVGPLGIDETVDLKTQGNCPWEATSGASWISFTGAISGLGPGVIPYTVAENDSALDRSGTVKIADQTLTVTQLGAAVEFDISPEGASFPQEGGTGTVEVTGTPDAGWAASSPASWIQIVGPSGGEGDGSLDYRVSANPSSASRSAELRIAGRPFTVMQAGRVTRSLTPWILVPGDVAGSAPPIAPTAIGVFGIEDEGQSRGPWLQVYDGEGGRLASTFLPATLEDAEVLSGQLDGTGGAELVIAGQGPQGAELFVRNSDGSGASRMRLFGGADVDNVTPLVMRRDGKNLVGVGAIRRADGAAMWQLLEFDRVDGRDTLRSMGEHEVVTGESSNHSWNHGDLDGDGRDELVLGYSEKDGTGASFRVVDAGTGAVMAERRALGGSFENATWMVGRFRRQEGQAPQQQNNALQIVLGAQRSNTGAGFMAMFDSSAKPVMRGRVTEGGVEHVSWRSVGVGDVQQLLVGYQDRANSWAFNIRDLSSDTSAPVHAGRALVADETSEVADWVIGDFDGEESNGEEVAVVTVDQGDRSIETSTWNRFGRQMGPSTSAFNGDHIAPQALATRPVDTQRDDLVLLVQRIGEAPRMMLMRFDGEGLFQRSVLGSGVR